MPDHIILRVVPVQCGARKIYPLVRISENICNYGGYISAEPVALVIEEEGEWFCTILGDDGDEKIETWLKEAG